MKKKSFIILSLTFLLIIILILIFLAMKTPKNKTEEIKVHKITGRILNYTSDVLTIQDKNNTILAFKISDYNLKIGSDIIIKYTGSLDKNKQLQKNVSINSINMYSDENSIPEEWLDNGLFSQYYVLAYDKLKQLSIEEKIGQLFLVRYPEKNQLEDLQKYHFGGYLFFEKDFKNKTKEEVVQMLQKVQEVSSIPLLTAVDEEGGKVVRVSSNAALAPQKFKSSQELYAQGKMEQIKDDTKEKSSLLNSLGINLNLAPVVDVSTNPSDYMYDRTIGQDTNITSQYAKTVIEASKNTGVSFTLKHFPGYGNNVDTHKGISIDNRTLEDIKQNDLPPFIEGVKSDAEAILVSHNIVTSIDSLNPSSLSIDVHNLLRNDVGFTGIVITDDIAMKALDSFDNPTQKAILAGNDLIITTDYEKSIQEVKEAINTNTINQQLIDKLAFRVLAWKYYKGLLK